MIDSDKVLSVSRRKAIKVEYIKIRVDNILKNKLEQIANNENADISTIVRTLIEDFIKDYDGKHPKTEGIVANSGKF